MARFPFVLAYAMALNTLRFFVCASLVGLAIKMMDDWLDRRVDGSLDRDLDRAGDPGPPGGGTQGSAGGNLASRLGDASLPYALFLFACGVPFDPVTAVALFLMAYAVGMGGTSSRDLYPSGLRGWQESALSVIISLVACGWRTTAVAGLCMGCIQGFDDIMDYRKHGAMAGPLPGSFGPAEVALTATSMACMSLALDMPRTAGIMAAAVFVWRLERAFRSGPRPPISP